MNRVRGNPTAARDGFFYLFLVALVLISCVATPRAQPISTARDSALHVLNRLAYGPRPGDVEHVAQAGVLRWLEMQLAGVDDAALRAREREFELLQHDADALARMVREAQRRRREEQRQRAQQNDDAKALPDAAPEAPMQDRAGDNAKSEDGGSRDPDMGNMRELRGQLAQIALVRAVESRNQLREVMSDFWFNHFNVFHAKGADRYLLPDYVENVIRPHALGRFEDLLIATAESPAMLFYLDNVQSISEGAVPPEMQRAQERAEAGTLPEKRRRQLQRARERMPKGLNENYARELLELHTLGVDGGYTQRDVVEVARIFTGWGMQRPRRGTAFEFRAWAHDRGHKEVLGVPFHAGGGREEGVRLLRMLANHPATMRYVSGKIATRLVGDVPPDDCIDAAVEAWKRSGGDIRRIVDAIVRTPEFWSQRYVRSKFKSPLEYVASAVRAVDGRVDSTPRLARVVAQLGQPLYMQPVPTGYPETQDEWVSSGNLLQRMNVAMALASGKLKGVALDLESLGMPTEAEPLVDALDARLLGGSMSENTRRVILEQIKRVRGHKQRTALAVGLALGGPEFQRQ
jgi:uncharacterized protein (DUF1800 family)